MIYKFLTRQIVKILLLLIILICGLYIQPLYAQKLQEDVLYLKNGSVLHGTIIEQKPGVSVKIQTTDRNIWVFTEAEVEKITKEEVPAEPQNLSKQKGYYNATTAGLMFSEIGLKATMANGYRFSPYLATGVFLSFDLYDNGFYAPLGIDLRGEILRKSITPYWVVQAGFPVIMPESSAWRKHTSKIMYQAGGGIMFMVGKKLALLTELGYKTQYVKYEAFNGRSNTLVVGQMRSINFNIGLQF